MTHKSDFELALNLQNKFWYWYNHSVSAGATGSIVLSNMQYVPSPKPRRRNKEEGEMNELKLHNTLVRWKRGEGKKRMSENNKDKVKESLEAYEKVEKSAWKVYEKAMQSAREVYEKVGESGLEVYEKAMMSAWEAYEKVEKPAWEAYEKAKKRIQK